MKVYLAIEVDFETNEVIDVENKVFYDEETLRNFIVKQRRLSKWYEYKVIEIE